MWRDSVIVNFSPSIDVSRDRFDDYVSRIILNSRRTFNLQEIDHLRFVVFLLPSNAGIDYYRAHTIHNSISFQSEFFSSLFMWLHTLTLCTVITYTNFNIVFNFLCLGSLPFIACLQIYLSFFIIHFFIWWSWNCHCIRRDESTIKTTIKSNTTQEKKKKISSSIDHFPRGIVLCMKLLLMLAGLRNRHYEQRTETSCTNNTNNNKIKMNSRIQTNRKEKKRRERKNHITYAWIEDDTRLNDARVQKLTPSNDNYQIISLLLRFATVEIEPSRLCGGHGGGKYKIDFTGK